jgi:hypothetical protein
MKEEILLLKTGDILLFKNVQISCPNGRIRNMGDKKIIIIPIVHL